jgi:two-component system response regulator NreC
VSTWRVLLADDHAVVRAGMRALLSAEPRCSVVGEAASIDELRTSAHHLKPDLVVLDLSFGVGNALDTIPALLAAPNPPRIVVLTMHDDVAFARQAFARGAHGYLVKEAAADELVRAVETVMSGATYLSPELGARAVRPTAVPAERLTERERDVLVRLARGFTNAEVARQLMISLRTVEAYRANLRERMGLASRADLFEMARRLGLL